MTKHKRFAGIVFALNFIISAWAILYVGTVPVFSLAGMAITGYLFINSH